MKVSGVVKSLNWKAFADKIHPNGATPLTSKESSRLLNALTSSFRKHLDEAHPVSLEYKPESGKDGVSTSKIDLGAMHSSAAFAQRHMASVLTNPLLVKEAKRLDHDTAKVELTKNAAMDPISLLEEYNEKGAATVHIAELCLEKAKSTYDMSSADQKQSYLTNIQAGHRVFLWLLTSAKYLSTSFANNNRFKHLMAFFLIREGREENLWQWLKKDIAHEPHEGPPEFQLSDSKKNWFRYRWRGRMLRGMAEVKMGSLDVPSSLPTTENVNAVFDTFFAAVDLKSSAGFQNHLWWTSLLDIGCFLEAKLRVVVCGTNPGKIHIDVARYDKFKELVPLYLMDVPQLYTKVTTAFLETFHPVRPTCDVALAACREIFSGSKLAAMPSPRPRVSEEEIWHVVWLMASKTVHLLKLEGRASEAAWLTDRIEEELPQRGLKAQLQEYDSMSNGSTQLSSGHQDEVLPPVRPLVRFTNRKLPIQLYEKLAI